MRKAANFISRDLLRITVTATFKKHEASPYDAEIVHGVHVESLREFASIRKTQSVIDQWRLWSEER